jgi:hypothetical protein
MTNFSSTLPILSLFKAEMTSVDAAQRFSPARQLPQHGWKTIRSLSPLLLFFGRRGEDSVSVQKIPCQFILRLLSLVGAFLNLPAAYRAVVEVAENAA